MYSNMIGEDGSVRIILSKIQIFPIRIHVGLVSGMMMEDMDLVLGVIICELFVEMDFFQIYAEGCNCEGTFI